MQKIIGGWENKYNLTISRVIGVVIAFAFLFLLVRTFELTAIKGAYYRDLSDGNRTRRIPITAPRGSILARGGQILAESVEVPKNIIFDSKKGYTLEKSEEGAELLVPDWYRNYPIGSASAHLTGYVGQPTDEQSGRPNPDCIDDGVLLPQSLVGYSGLEKMYECHLQGALGEELVEVDSKGGIIRVVGRKPPVKGRDLATTIDYELQKAVFAALNSQPLPGAVVVTDTSGQILSLVSTPSFDPNLFFGGTKSDPAVARGYLIDPGRPLFNRVVSGVYHPGSIYKMLIGVAAFEEGVISPDFTYTDTGVVSVAGFDYRTWYFTKYGRTEGNINFSQALARSTDTFFYVVGGKVGINKLVDWASVFGVGRKTGIDLPGEAQGILPSPDWKRQTYGEPWYLGNTYHFSIGQGDVNMTPIQASTMTEVFANGGRLCAPYINSTDGLKSDNCKKLDISPQVLSEVVSAMTKACETGGTGAPFFTFEPKVACKTGTAETGEESPTHAWFQVFAPVESPEIMVTVIIEKGGEGSQAAAPVARKILDYWFLDRQTQQ